MRYKLAITVEVDADHVSQAAKLLEKYAKAIHRIYAFDKHENTTRNIRGEVTAFTISDEGVYT